MAIELIYYENVILTQQKAIMTIVHPFGAKPISKAKVASYTANFAKRGSNANKENIPSSSQPAAHIPSPQPPSTSSPSPELIQQKKLAKNQRRTLVRAQKKVSDLKETIVGLKAEHTVALRETQLTIANLQADTVTLRSRIEGLETHIEDAFKSTTQYQANIAALKKRIARFGSVIQTTVKRTKRKAQSTRSKVTAHRGVYNTEARDLARRLRLAGCAPSKIGPLIVRIAASFGVQVTKQMSRRTVQRCMLEALAASDIQLVEEMGQNEGHTLSQDSTSNRSINYQAHQLTMRVPDYDGGETVPDPKSIPRTRLLRVASTVDHTAPTSVAMWIDLLQASLETYNNSPMARRASKSFSLRKFAMKMKGMCSDHASAEKAAFDLLKGWKESETMQDLGEKELTKMDMLELLVFLSDRKSALIESLGGMEKWDELGDVVQSEHEAQLLKDLKDELGRKEYDSMPPEARSALNLFIWAGCCMHKDQNSFKGGAEAMGLSWALAGLTLPLILANKASAAKIRDILNPGRKDAPLTPEEEEAIAASTRGGVKAAALAGALFNNKDDKKGFGDTHLIHLFAAFGLKESHRFPDTSNTRFTTYGLAACELLKHLDFYRSFLDDARLRKQRVGWTNIELNLYNALHDAPTLTELAVMALYTQSVTHPYLRVVRGSGEDTVNALDLGPFHLKVRSHCEAIIANPDLLIAPDASFEKGSLDGKDWEDNDAILAVRKLDAEGKFPNLRGATVAFFNGALATWIRFSAEFAPGGTIDTLSQEERDLAWMPATNDVNEGALGAYRVYMRNRPNTTLLNYNAFAVCQKNDTLAFMKAKFTEEDNQYVRKVARDWDSSGMERERRETHANAEKQLAEMKRAKEASTKKEAQERRDRLTAVTFVAICDIKKLRVRELDEQLDALKFRGGFGDDIIPKKTKRGLQKDKQQLLEKVLVGWNSQENTVTQEPEATIIVDTWAQDGDELEKEMADEDEMVD